MVGGRGELLKTAWCRLLYGTNVSNRCVQYKQLRRRNMRAAEAIFFVLAAEGLISRVWERDCCRSWRGVESIIGGDIGHYNA